MTRIAARLFPPCMAMAIVALFYALTICRTLYWGDGLELTAAAWSLGISHPTGYPLYMLLGRIFLDLPVGSPAFRMNLLSAVSLLVASGLFYGLMMDLLKLIERRQDLPGIWQRIFCAGMSVAFGLSLLVWQHAVLTEVYGTFVALYIGCLWLLVRAFVQRQKMTLITAFLLYGILFQAHMLAIVLAPVYALLALQYLKPQSASLRSLFSVARTLPLFIAFAIGLSGYLYLPIRARQHPPMNWGSPDSISRLKDHLTGGQYKQTRLLSDPVTLQPLRGYQLQEYLRTQSLRILGWTGEQFTGRSPSLHLQQPPSRMALSLGAVIWLLSLSGLITLWRRQSWLGISIGLSLVLVVLVLLVYTIADIETYFLAAWPIMLALAGIAIVALAQRREAKSFSPIPAILLVAIAALAARNNYAACDLSDYREAEKFGQRLLDPKNVPPDSLLLLEGDGAIFVAWYLQTAEGKRPDVILYGTNFIFYDWYKHYFERPQDKGFTLFSKPLSLQPEAEFLVALGGGVIIPNILQRPILAVPATPWLQQVLMNNWNGEIVANLLPADTEFPPVAAATPGQYLIRLADNPEYRAYQTKQFEEMYGKDAVVTVGQK